MNRGIALLLLAGCSEYEVYKQEAADIFYQLDASEVDILLVVDNSCSMQPYQQQLADNFDNFLTYFVEGNVDYQIGVVSTTTRDSFSTSRDCQAEADSLPGGGILLDGAIITPDTNNASSRFSEIVNVGICGDPTEAGLEAARLALDYASSGDENRGFLRDDAFLSIIFVSDEQDASIDPVNDYLNDFRAVKAAVSERADMNASALVVSDEGACSNAQINSGATLGSRYVDVANQSGGLVGNICSDEFDSIVTELSLNSSRLTDTFYLTDLPQPASLVVGVSVDGEVTEQDCSEGWTYDLLEEDGEQKPVIIFDRSNLPPPRAKITVKYDRGSGDPSGFCE